MYTGGSGNFNIVHLVADNSYPAQRLTQIRRLTKNFGGGEAEIVDVDIGLVVAVKQCYAPDATDRMLIDHGDQVAEVLTELNYNGYAYYFADFPGYFQIQFFIGSGFTVFVGIDRKNVELEGIGTGFLHLTGKVDPLLP